MDHRSVMDHRTVMLERRDIEFDEDLPHTVCAMPVVRARGSHCEIEFVPVEVATKRPRWMTALFFGALLGIAIGLALSAPRDEWTRNQFAPVTTTSAS
jgi:hypothetical protein